PRSCRPSSTPRRGAAPASSASSRPCSSGTGPASTATAAASDLVEPEHQRPRSASPEPPRGQPPTLVTLVSDSDRARGCQGEPMPRRLVVLLVAVMAVSVTAVTSVTAL